MTLFTLDGVPFLYNGQEVADTARHSIFGRSPIDWANGETPAGASRLAFCRILCTLRHTEAALTQGKIVWLDNDTPEAVLSRSQERDILLFDVAGSENQNVPFFYGRLLPSSHHPIHRRDARLLPAPRPQRLHRSCPGSLGRGPGDDVGGRGGGHA